MSTVFFSSLLQTSQTCFLILNLPFPIALSHITWKKKKTNMLLPSIARLATRWHTTLHLRHHQHNNKRKSTTAATPSKLPLQHRQRRHSTSNTSKKTFFLPYRGVFRSRMGWRSYATSRERKGEKSDIDDDELSELQRQVYSHSLSSFILFLFLFLFLC